MSNIPEDGLSLRFTESREWLNHAMSGQAESFACTRDIQVSCILKRLGENVFLEGAATTVLDLSCCRCLETAAFSVDASFRYTLVPVPDHYDGEVELTGDDLEYSYYENDTIDLEPLIFEQIILQVPIKTLCREDCLGLCPRCGANLNTAPCHCRDGMIDERFAALKSIRIEKNKYE